jgi:streptogramin lyase
MRSHVRCASVCVVVVASIVGVVIPAGATDKAGQVTEFAAGLSPVVLAGNQYGPDLAGISAGPDGNVWFTERLGVRLGRITPDGVITELAGGFPLAVVDGEQTTASPTGITTGPDGNVWVGDEIGPRIGRSTPDGAITVFADGITALTYYTPVEITAGPDGNLWFTEFADPIG